eukprot:g2918.t1
MKNFVWSFLREELRKVEEDIHDYGWVPTTKSGKQKTPGQIRAAVRKYIQRNGITSNKFRKTVDVNSNSWSKFMKGQYKNQWSACSNSSYWAAARFLALEAAREKHRKKEIREANKIIKKRKRDGEYDENVDPEMVAISKHRVTKSTKKSSAKADAQALVDRICAVTDVSDASTISIYENCDIVRRKIATFLNTPGMTKSCFLKALQCQAGSLNTFMKYKGKGSGAANKVYSAAYRFFEQKRIMEDKPKSKNRREQEARWGKEGYERRHDNGKRLVFGEKAPDPRIFDIDFSKDRRNQMGF